MWYGGVAGEGLRSVGEEALPSSKSGCSILPIARYDVEYSPRTDRLREVKRPRLFSHRFAVAQLRLFELDALGESGWLKAVRLEGYVPRSPRRPQVLQQALFPYATVL